MYCGPFSAISPATADNCDCSHGFTSSLSRRLVLDLMYLIYLSVTPYLGASIRLASVDSRISFTCSSVNFILAIGFLPPIKRRPTRNPTSRRGHSHRNEKHHIKWAACCYSAIGPLTE